MAEKSTAPMRAPLPHSNDKGEVLMIGVADKPETRRLAVARGEVRMAPATLERLRDQSLHKGDALATARVAGILAAKDTARLIPLCHPLPLTRVEVDIALDPARSVAEISATAETVGRTGVEMEALSAVSVAALTLYDMLKGIDKALVISSIRLVRKEGGRSGTWDRDPLGP